MAGKSVPIAWVDIMVNGEFVARAFKYRDRLDVWRALGREYKSLDGIYNFVRKSRQQPDADARKSRP